MPLTKPYKRIYRPYTDGRTSFDADYTNDSRYASDPSNYLRAYRLLEHDLLSTFDYVDPSDTNLKTYSHQFFQLLLRACTEFEANAKEILRANNYPRTAKLNLLDYVKLEKACRLSEYNIVVPTWDGTGSPLVPFAEWRSSHSLSWYQDYNAVKHDRAANFNSANLKNALNAVAAVLIILFAQFNISAFDPYHSVEMYSEDDNGRLSHPSCFLIIQLPTGWTVDEQYDFDWTNLKGQTDPFQNFSF